MAYCPQLGGWQHYQNGVWKTDDNSTAEKLGHELVERLAASKSAAEREWAKKLGNRIPSMMNRAAEILAVSPDQFDSVPELFNCANCTLDLSGKEPRKRGHSPADYLRHQSPAVYDPEAECPQFDKFFSEICAKPDKTPDPAKERYLSDPDKERYLLKLIGQAMRGRQDDHLMPILQGGGGNGKTQLANLILKVFGSYASAAPVNLLLVSSYDSPGENATPFLASLKGVFVVIASEPRENAVLNESLIKLATGGDAKLKVRDVHCKAFEYRPQFTIFLLTNPRPKFYGTDRGIRRRLKLIPFYRDFQLDEKVPEIKGLADILIKEELSGVLNRFLEGLRWYREEGLVPPLSIAQETDLYIGENDILQHFLDESIEKAGLQDRLPHKDVFRMYCQWTQENGVHYKLDSQRLANKLRQKGWVGATIHRNWLWFGWRLLSVEEKSKVLEGELLC